MADTLSLSSMAERSIPHADGYEATSSPRGPDRLVGSEDRVRDEAEVDRAAWYRQPALLGSPEDAAGDAGRLDQVALGA